MATEETGHRGAALIESGALIDGRYRLHSIIGAGGMGVVWSATHEGLERRVALKQIPLDLPGGEPAERLRARTLNEARIVASLHLVDGVVRIANYFADQNNVWLELEYLDALNLAELIHAAGGLPPAEVAWIGARVARALSGGHALDPPVLHRDVKPGNVLVGRDGGTVKLGDYGISLREGDPTVTTVGAIHATLAYAAPEVVREHRTTIDSDMWSLGATLYHAVEGRLPYGDHDDDQSLIEAVRAAAVQPIQKAGPQLGPLLLRMLVVTPESRLDADAAAEKLDRIAQPPGEATLALLRGHRPERRTTLLRATRTATPVVEPAGRTGHLRHRMSGAWSGRRRRVIAVVCAVAVAVGALVVPFRWPWTQEEVTTAAPAPAIADLPPSIGYVALASQSTDVDPCRLLDVAALRSTGTYDVDPGENIAACTVTLHGVYPTALVTVDVGNANMPSPARRPPIDLGGLTIVAGMKPAGPGFGCYNYLVLSDRSKIAVFAFYPTIGSAADDFDGLCSISDMAAAGVARELARLGNVPTTSGRGARITLGRTDACGIIDRSIVPTIKYAPAKGFNSWSCTLGSTRTNDERVETALQFLKPLPGSDTIGPYRAWQGQTSSTSGGLKGCATYVEVAHQAAVAPGKSETVRFAYFRGGVTFDEQCARSRRLAQSAVTKLPAPTV